MAYSTDSFETLPDGRSIDSDVPATHQHRMHAVLIVDNEPDSLNFLRKGLGNLFGLVEVAPSAEVADALVSRCHFDLIIVDISLPDRPGVEWVAHLREQDLLTAVIFMTRHADVQMAITALRAGASDFIMKPFRLEQMQASVNRCMERLRLQKENFLLRRQIRQMDGLSNVVGDCELIQEVCAVIKRVAPMPSTVLIEGESGTGKDLAARAIHNFSGRRGPFVPINCGAIQPDLLESELFGHAKGAFTGAVKAREGLFSYADGGTLFLDEIGEMPMAMQTRLLRVMEDRKIRLVGSNCETSVDVRVLAATNRDLKTEVNKGHFREDLFYRLNVLTIRMPALRERLEDMPALVTHFASVVAADLGVAIPNISDSEIQNLGQYDWPGNIRELKNVIERSLLLGHRLSQGLVEHSTVMDFTAHDENNLTLKEVEKRHILQMLAMESGNKSAAARRLGVSRKTLERKCQAWESEN